MCNRFARGEDVFANPDEAIEFAELLREVKRRDGRTVYAWACCRITFTWRSEHRQCLFRERCSICRGHPVEGSIADGDERVLSGRAGTKFE